MSGPEIARLELRCSRACPSRARRGISVVQVFVPHNLAKCSEVEDADRPRKLVPRDNPVNETEKDAQGTPEWGADCGLEKAGLHLTPRPSVTAGTKVRTGRVDGFASAIQAA